VLPENDDSLKSMPKPDRVKKILFWILRFVVSFGILCYLLMLIPMEKVLESIRSVKIVLAVIAILFTQLMTYVSAMKSKILTDEHEMSLSVGKIFKINYVTQFYGLFLPEVVSSGLIRWQKLAKPDRKPAEALASMIFSRFTEILVLLCLGLLFWTLDRSSNTSNNYLGLILAICVLSCVVIYYVAFNRNVSIRALGIVSRFNFIPGKYIEKLHKLLYATSHYRTLKKATLFKVIGLNVAKDMIGISCFYMLARSVNINVDILSIAWVRTYVQVLALLPISVSGLGIQEGSLIFLLGSFGYPMQSAVAFSFLLHVRKIIGGGIGGLIQALDLVTTAHKKPEMGEVI
jgi:uncharacterized protein (TIRG00374 family)